MKKIFSLIAIAAVASTMFTSCSSKDEVADTKPVGGAKLTLSVDKLALKAGDKGKFTITSDIAALEAIAISVKSSDVAKLTVDPASVTIAKDQKTIEGTYTAVADGKAKITITTTSTIASVAKGEIEVTVGDAPVPDNSILTTTIEMDGAFGQIMLPGGAEGWQVGGVWTNNYAWGDEAGGAPERTSIDNYGCKVVGTLSGKQVRLAILDADVEINSSLAWVANTDRPEEYIGENTDIAPFWTMAPDIYITGSYTENAGKSGYAVCEFYYENTAEDIAAGFYPGWVKVSVSATGEVTADEMALCVGGGTFKTGQK